MSGRGRPRKPAGEGRTNKVDTYLCDWMHERLLEECRRMGSMSQSEYISMVLAKEWHKEESIRNGQTDGRKPGQEYQTV